MTESVTANSALTNISSSYVSTTEETTDDTLGRTEFLTLLVAQLENQDPMNPQDGTDFTAQLAEYSQLEQLMNLNDSMEGLSSALQTSSESDGVDYIGKSVTGYIDSMEVSEGTVTSGFYNLTVAADVMVDVYDADGNKVHRLYLGQESPGGQLVTWDGTDANGDSVPDGTYTYVVQADSGSGYEKVDTSVTGIVDGVTYNNGTPYLVVQGVLVNIDDITAVSDLQSESYTESIMDYLGRGVTSDAPIILLEGGEVSGGDLEFDLESVESVTVNVYDAYDELVNSISVDASDVQEGANFVSWNGLGEDGSELSDGLYYYTVQTESGEYANMDVSGEVSAIKNLNNVQYLVLDESGRLLSLSNVDQVY